MAKRRGRKRRSSGKDKPAIKPGSTPEGFWRQTVAFILGAVIAPLIVLAMFGLGGSLPARLYGSARWAVGAGAYIIPAVLVYASVKMFRADNHRLDRATFWGIALFLMSMSGLLHLTVGDGDSLAQARLGKGGGFLGYITDAAIFPWLDTIGSTLVLFAAGLISALFILKVPLKDFFGSLLKVFRRKKVGQEGEVAQQKGNGKFKLNEGVPIEKGAAKIAAKLKTPSTSKPASAPATIHDPKWKLPKLDLLESKQEKADPGDIDANAEIIRSTLADFGIKVEMEGANLGPRVTQYTLRPPAGVKLSKITSLENNLALSLAAESIRIEAPIPGKQAVGIEVPNRKAASVGLKALLKSKEWRDSSTPLSFVVGSDISGKPVIDDLALMPHLLIAGQTGSGKSVMINTLLVSFLYRNPPSNLRMILIDPKRLGLKAFDAIPHLLTPIIYEPDKTVSALKWSIGEMERRSKIIAETGAQNIIEYNQLEDQENLPYVVIVIDELSDLMSVAARDIESLIVRLAQKSRALGLHLVLATQRPSVDVVTGLIKANVPGRIAFSTASQVDSRTIIDRAGAEKLLGNGDMLFVTPRKPKARRIQGAFIDTSELRRVTDFIRLQREPQYDNDVVSQPVQLGGGGIGSMSGGGADDPLFEDAVELVIETGKASASFLQRRFSIGYTRAARLIDSMEEKGIVAPGRGNKPRQVLVSEYTGNDDTDGDAEA